MRRMRRFRALLLLVTLLASPVGVVTALAFPMLQDCCCSGAMCPMHRNQKSQQGGMPCQHTNPRQQICTCGPSQQVQVVLPPFAPEAILTTYAIVFRPVTAHEVANFTMEPILIRSISPPDQPPRL